MAQKVSLYIRKNGSRNYELADPKTIYPLGTIFVLRYERDGKRVWETLAGFQNYQTAKAQAMRKEIDRFTGENSAPHKPLPVPKPVSTPDGQLMLDAAMDRYLENVRIKSERTSDAYGYALKQFFLSCKNKPLAQINKQDLINFVGFLRKDDLSDRTIHNRVGEIVTFLRHFGITEVKLRVKYVEQKVRAYRPDEVKALFSAAAPEEWMLFQFFLCTGAREQEVMYAEWDTLDFVDGLFTVKQTARFKPKDFEEREIPIPDHLVLALKQRMLNTQGGLIFPTPTGKPNGHMLRILKDLAKRAGLVGEFKLHKWRKTYATLQHKAGIDARTIQKRLGHSDLSTTLAYLEGEDARSERSRQQVNQTFGGFGKETNYLTQ